MAQKYCLYKNIELITWSGTGSHGLLERCLGAAAAFLEDASPEARGAGKRMAISIAALCPSGREFEALATRLPAPRTRRVMEVEVPCMAYLHHNLYNSDLQCTVGIGGAVMPACRTRQLQAWPSRWMRMRTCRL